MPLSDKIAFLGTGLMGRPMAGRLIEAGFPVTVWNRTGDKALPLADQGAAVAESPADAVSGADCVVLMLADHPAITDTLFSPDAAGALSGRTILQMGTIAPAQSVDLGRKLAEHGGQYLEAPVLGSTPEAAEGRLLVMVGATAGQFERWSGLLKSFGPEPLLVGEVGQAAALKLAMNQLIAGLTASFSFSLALVEKSGVPVDRFMDLLRKSALYAPTFDKKLSRMTEGHFADPNFPTKHLAKDVNLFFETAKSLGLAVEGFEGVRRIVERAAEEGLAEDDYSAIFEIIKGRR